MRGPVEDTEWKQISCIVLKVSKKEKIAYFRLGFNWYLEDFQWSLTDWALCFKIKYKWLDKPLGICVAKEKKGGGGAGRGTFLTLIWMGC